ncbi:MAG: AzlD domain-containing protein [Alkalilacustris sp.]
MSLSTTEIWVVILVLGAGTFLIRFSFLGLGGAAGWPPLVLRLLRYTPVAVIPGLVAPLVIWPQATDGVLDAPRMAAAVATLAVGLWLRSATWAIVAGAVVLTILLRLGL